MVSGTRPTTRARGLIRSLRRTWGRLRSLISDATPSRSSSCCSTTRQSSSPTSTPTNRQAPCGSRASTQTHWATSTSVAPHSRDYRNLRARRSTHRRVVREVSVVETVRGAVPAVDLGVTLPHEHLCIDLTCYWAPTGDDQFGNARIQLPLLGLLRSHPFSIRDNCLLDDTEVALDEVEQFRGLGGCTIVDVTLPDIGRDRLALLELSRASAGHIVAGCGHYVYISHPPTLAEESVEAVTERLLLELNQ